jgi:hypothetical protein
MGFENCPNDVKTDTHPYRADKKRNFSAQPFHAEHHKKRSSYYFDNTCEADT